MPNLHPIETSLAVLNRDEIQSIETLFSAPTKHQ